MVMESRDIAWGQEQRLEFLESQLFWKGGVNRSDLVREFGLSVPQASKDLSLYQAKAPQNVRYDKSKKRYLASEQFRPQFVELDAETYLRQLQNGEQGEGSTSGFETETLPIPKRRIQPEILRRVAQAAQARVAIDVRYQSMNPAKPEPLSRRISPRAFASDGLRWHVRAYCHESETFKDFILARMISVGKRTHPGNGSEDAYWNERFTVVLRPNPKLSEGQQRAVALDFGMSTSSAAISVRKAMLYYFVRRLRLDLDTERPSEAPIVADNRAELMATLEDVAG